MKAAVALASLCCAVALTSCGGDKSGARDTTAGKAAASSASSGGGDLTGAGSTFANPLYQKWAADYATKTGVKVNYQSIGSGGGIRQLSELTVDFGATDGPMSDDEISKAKGGAILHVPTALGGVVVTYNLPAVAQPLKLTGDVVAGIFLGKITRWNDAKLAALNPGVALPGTDIVVVHRSDGSGTSYVFTDYLNGVSPEWAKVVGKGKDVKWPVGLGGKGNEGVAGQVRQTPGAIGYVELAYANQNKMSVASIKNASGAFVAPTVASITAAASGVADKVPPNTDYRLSIVNAPGATAYPISSFTWILLYKTQSDATKGKKLVDFVRWGLSDGQALEAALDYAPLPDAMLVGLRQRLDSVKVGAP
jgi:phosphate transport system substrate-binding protein